MANPSPHLGTVTVDGPLISSGGEIKGVRVVTAAGTITMLVSDRYIIVNKTSGAATAVTLMSGPSVGQVVTIKDGKGDASTHNITITAATGNIDGSSNVVLNVNYSSIDLLFTGTVWNIV